MPFEVPESWCWVSLSDVCNVARGGSPRPIKEYLTDDKNGINWIKIGDADKDGKYINSTKEKILPSGASKSRMVHKGDFLLTNSMSFGRPYILNIDGCIHDGWLVISPIHKTYDPEFLYYLLSSGFAYSQFTEAASGGVVSNLNSDKVGNSLFPLPPQSEQKRIVSELDKLFEAIRLIDNNKLLIRHNIEQIRSKILELAISGKLVHQNTSDEPAIELLKRINPAYKPADNRHYGNTKITIPLNWCWVKLGEIFDVVSAKRVFQSEWQKTGIPFYRAREIVKLSNCGHVDNELYISIEHFESLKNKYGAPEADDIMLSAVGTIGKCYIVNKNDRFYYKDASVLCLKNIHNLNSEYIKFVLDSSVVQMQMQDQSKGTTVDTITIEKAKGYYIPLPPVTEQSRIVKAIALINHTIDKIAAIL